MTAQGVKRAGVASATRRGRATLEEVHADVGRALDASLRARMMAEGLAGEIEAVRQPEGTDLVPTPGMAVLQDRIEAGVGAVGDRAELIGLLLSDPERSDELDARIRAEAADAHAGAEAVGRTVRQLAQLALGVSSRLGPGSRVDKLDRTAVAVLAPFDHQLGGVALEVDKVELFCHTRDEVRVELGGVLCRLLVDGLAGIQIGPTWAWVVSDGVLHLETPGGERSWEPPVTVGEPAEIWASALFDAGLTVEQIASVARMEMT